MLTLALALALGLLLLPLGLLLLAWNQRWHWYWSVHVQNFTMFLERIYFYIDEIPYCAILLLVISNVYADREGEYVKLVINLIYSMTCLL